MIAANCPPRSRKYAVCERVSSVVPDFEAERKSVRCGSIFDSSARIAFGCVVSRTWKRSAPNVSRSTSGASDEPPMPSTTKSSIAPAETTSFANARTSSSCSEHALRLVEPAEPLASSPPVQTVGSRAQIRSTMSVATAHAQTAASASRFALIPCFSSVEGVDELLHALALERVRHVVVVETRLAQLVEQLPRLVDPLLERTRRRRRDPGRRRSSPRASCSPCRGRSAPRRRSRRGSPGSSWTSTPRGSAARSRPSPRARSQRSPENTRL